MYVYHSDFTEELENALDEIKKNEKETHTLAMVAQTLYEAKDSLSMRVTDLETELLESRSSVTQYEQMKDELLSQLEESKNQLYKYEMVKEDQEKTIQALTTKKQRTDNKNEILTTKNS